MPPPASANVAPTVQPTPPVHPPISLEEALQAGSSEASVPSQLRKALHTWQTDLDRVNFPFGYDRYTAADAVLAVRLLSAELERMGG